MLQSLCRLGLVSVFLLSAVLRAEAALIVVNESSDTGGGTLVNDGSGDVSSSNGSSSGFTQLMSDLGLETFSWRVISRYCELRGRSQTRWLKTPKTCRRSQGI